MTTPFVMPSPVRVSIRIHHPLHAVAIAHGFAVEREYSTVRHGYTVSLRAPDGTRWAGKVGRATEETGSIVRYVTPDGWWFEAGGGGPSDLDVLRVAREDAAVAS